MVCGGFSCSKNCLCALNLLYTLVSLLLIGIAAWGIGFGLISSLRVVGVVIAVGIFLFLIALVGLIGAVKHHQVLLFFYMIILLLVFIVQFSVSCACLALNREQQGQLLEVGWNNTASARNDIQRNLNCCGFRSYNPNDTCPASCAKSTQKCSSCAPIIGEYAGEVLRFVGGIGLFFSFTEVCSWTLATLWVFLSSIPPPPLLFYPSNPPILDRRERKEQRRKGVTSVSDLGQAAEVHFLHTNVNQASRFSQHPPVMADTPPSMLNFASQGLGFPQKLLPI
uniref:Tetraspanin-13 n=1 Tax=Mus spicilegus TaxID=10103 RepID=A0A8C6GH61_MUSSI